MAKLNEELATAKANLPVYQKLLDENPNDKDAKANFDYFNEFINTGYK
ncbi:MAG: hypothetical protein Nk1A_7760 [Endomicrobiia bacterium]|nr:MAG: hypothetical protein Nk1A_7760 [Endomicrobiia bacterium]